MERSQVANPAQEQAAEAGAIRTMRTEDGTITRYPLSEESWLIVTTKRGEEERYEIEDQHGRRHISRHDLDQRRE